jgi:D-glycero-D-manno-heptose 1,7-bisphosphate phosphatase
MHRRSDPPEGVRFAAAGPSPDPAAPRCPALFLDRDGVVVEEVEYLHRVDDLRLLPGAAELVKRARKARLAVVFVSNQSGIDRGLYGWDAYDDIETEIDRRLAAAGANVDARAACGFHPEFTPGWDGHHAHWRKPGPGMLELAADRLALDLGRSWLVGDMATDVRAARAAGLAGCVHVLTGHGAAHRAGALAEAAEGFEVLAADDLAGAGATLAAHGALR